MKIRNLMVATTLFVAAGAMAQNQDCAFFFPNQEGEQITRNCYTANGKLTNILVYKVDQAYDYPSGMEVVANYTFTDASGKTLNSGQMVARCNDGNFSMSMGDVATFPTALNMMNADVYMMGDLMNYPNAFSDPMNPGDDDEFDDGTLRLYQKGNKNNRAEISIFDREFVATETVNTPAGAFYCTKVKYEMNIWTPQETIKGYGYEWYAPNIGIVRSEQYNNKKKLQSYSVLERIKK